VLRRKKWSNNIFVHEIKTIENETKGWAKTAVNVALIVFYFKFNFNFNCKFESKSKSGLVWFGLVLS